MLRKLNTCLMLLVLFLVGCGGGCSGAVYNVPYDPPRYINSPANVDHLMDSTVSLVRLNPLVGDLDSYCTAFYVSPRTLATAAHCVAVAGGDRPLDVAFVTYRQWLRDGQGLQPPSSSSSSTTTRFYTASVVATDFDNDVALLSVARGVPSTPNFLEINNRTGNLKIGNQVYVVGNPGTFNWILSEGIISQLIWMSTPAPRHLGAIEASAPVFFGNSGSALVDNHGRVIGVVVAIGHRQSYLGITIPINAVVRLQTRAIVR